MSAAAVLLAAAQAAAAGAADDLGPAREAWTAGRLFEAGAAAERVLDAHLASTCPGRPEAAQAAFMAGVASAAAAPEVERRSSVLFWIALEADRRGGGLPRGWRDAARALAGNPGAMPGLDDQFLATPFFPRGRAPAQDCPASAPAAPRGPADGTEGPVVVLAELTARRDGRRVEAEVFFAYPDGEGRRLAGELQETRAAPGGLGGTVGFALVFDPCLEIGDREGAYAPLCREGARPAATP